MKKIFYFMSLLATMAVFTACSSDDDEEEKKDNPELLEKSYTLYHNGVSNIEGDDNVKDLEWDVENEFVATVNDGVITGQYVGKTTVKSTTDRMSFSVEVKPQYLTYEEPSLDWGASKKQIKEKYGIPAEEEDDGFVYQTSDSNAPLRIYTFDEDDKVEYIGVFVNSSAASTLGYFLTERYMVADVDNDIYTAYFMHGYGKLSDPHFDYGVGMKLDVSLGGFLVVYVKVDDKKSRGISGVDFDTAFQRIGDALK